MLCAMTALACAIKSCAIKSYALARRVVYERRVERSSNAIVSRLSPAHIGISDRDAMLRPVPGQRWKNRPVVCVLDGRRCAMTIAED